MSDIVPYKPPTSVGEAMSVGKVLAESGFFQDSRGAAQAVAKILAGAELGFGPVASMTGVNIIKGRVTLSANLMAAAIKRHPAYTYRLREHTTERCVLDFVERGEVVGESSFSMDDAKQAGLAGSENYRKYPRNMLFSRALSNGAKWYCPDVFGGAPVYTPDELGAEVDGETGEIVAVPEDASVGFTESPGGHSTARVDDSPYVGDDDHAPEYIDRGGRDTRTEAEKAQRPELKSAAAGLKWVAIKDCYTVAGLAPPAKAAQAFTGLDDVEAAALEAALRNRRFHDLEPTDAPYGLEEIRKAHGDTTDVDDLPWSRSDAGVVDTAESVQADQELLPLPTGSAPIDAEISAEDLADAYKRLAEEDAKGV